MEKHPERDDADEAAFAAGAEAAIALLAAVREQRSLLLALEPEQRARLLRLAGEVAQPDAATKRELSRAARRRKKRDQRELDEQVLTQTGIRQKRLEPVFVTPLRHPVVPVLAGEDIDRALAQEAHSDPPPDAAASVSMDAPPQSAGGALLVKERSCYVCKQRFTSLHFFYDSMCGKCGDLNWQKRNQSADLSGRVALVTGSRVKIGYHAAIMLLRAGARVIVTTRFPRDAAQRYAAEPDFDTWGERLQVYGLDLRHTPSVEALAQHLNRTLDRLDFILNNACQTVRRPAGFYAHLMQGEQTQLAELPAPAQRLLAAYERLRGEAQRPALARDAAVDAALAVATTTDAIRHAGLHRSAALSQLALLADDLATGPQLFPHAQLDADLQQVDLRTHNSWRYALADVSTTELLEVQLVNAIAPFVLNARLKPLMLRHPSRDKHIVNVSAMEGQFYRSFKTDKHPHTNMAKAALNMLTRTSARDYVQDGIHMNSVDTGWVTDEDPAAIAARKQREQGFHPPLDVVDGAARICDPIFSGFQSGQHLWGLFLKDYAATDW